MADVHNFISTALKEGHPIEDIVGFLGESDNPEEKAWAQRWQATAAQPAYESGATQQAAPEQPNTSMLEDFSNLSTPAKIATGAGVLAGSALLGAGAYAGKKAIDVAADVRREKALSQIEPSAAVKVQQGDLALRQAQFEASRQGAPTGEVPLSPVEQIKLEREKLKLEADRQKLAREAELHTQKITQMARQQELNEAKAKVTAAKQAAASVQTKTASGAIDPAVKQMLVSSEIATIDKAVDAGVKAAAKPPVVNAPIQPPSAPVQLTPSAEVLAEPVTPVAKSASIGTAPVESAPVAGAVPPKAAKSKSIPAFKSTADIPEGLVFRPDVGNLDRSLINILGPEGRLYAKEVLNEGKMFGEYKGADYNKKVKELVGAYGEKLKEITPSIDLTTREGRIAAGVPHTQNYGSALGKAAKVGGVLGTLMTVAQSANAREAVGNVAESLLPIGVTPSELQPGTLTAKQLKAFEESKKLGSPYRSVPPPK